MSVAEYDRVLFERMHDERRWQNRPVVGWTVADLDVAEIRNTVAEAVRIGRLNEPGVRDPEDLLRVLGMLRGGVLFRAAAVLSGNSERLLRDTPPIASRFEWDRMARIDEPLFPPLAMREALVPSGLLSTTTVQR